MTINTAPVASDVELFGEQALHEPYPYWQQLRDAGPAVYLSQYSMWFLGRYEQVRDALSDWKTFSSAQGIGLNQAWNTNWSNALICLDPPEHTEQRKLFRERLSRRALQPVADGIEGRAERLADDLLARGRFDAVTDLAHDLPVNVIMDLIGWPERGRGRLLDMASAWFEAGGPSGDRVAEAEPTVDELITYLTETVCSGTLTAGGFGSTMLESHRRGEITFEAAVGLLAGYVVAAFDTTINAIASGIWLFAGNPEQWEILHSDSGLASSAVAEILRMESPIQYFSRVTTREVDLGEGVVLPANARVVLGYGAANRDERHYSAPDEFDIRRNPRDHLAFSKGIHACAGQDLARLETEAIFRALASRVHHIELTNEPTRALNNLIRGLTTLPVQVS